MKPTRVDRRLAFATIAVIHTAVHSRALLQQYQACGRGPGWGPSPTAVHGHASSYQSHVVRRADVWWLMAAGWWLMAAGC